MYTINKFQENEFSFLELKNTDSKTTAKISLDIGGSLQELKFKDVLLINEQPNFDYKNSYASSILFPFVSRIQEGKYTFQENNYQFNCNDSGKNALHGLVYNKKFILISEEVNANFCEVTIGYTETNKSIGFPFTYEIYVTYTLSENNISLAVKVKNTDSNTFPFTLGWHPYFNCEDLNNSSLHFLSDQKVEFDENLITKKIIDHNTEEEFKIGNQQLDDCFILNSDAFQFKTPAYQVEISSNKIENYLQLYTPKDLPVIAIEPMTGISNSFNNKIGLQVLQPNETYSIEWNVKKMKPLKHT